MCRVAGGGTRPRDWGAAPAASPGRPRPECRRDVTIKRSDFPLPGAGEEPQQIGPPVSGSDRFSRSGETREHPLGADERHDRDAAVTPRLLAKEAAGHRAYPRGWCFGRKAVFTALSRHQDGRPITGAARALDEVAECPVMPIDIGRSISSHGDDPTQICRPVPRDRVNVAVPCAIRRTMHRARLLQCDWPEKSSRFANLPRRVDDTARRRSLYRVLEIRRRAARRGGFCRTDDQRQ